MIEGVKVTVKGVELAAICRDRANYHAERMEVYRKQASALADLGAEMREANSEALKNFTNSPKSDLVDKQRLHASKLSELKFVADHVDPNESYLLDQSDLVRIGVIKDRY